MTPKEKAKELLWKYLPILEGWKREDSILAKHCALITVNEIIDIVGDVPYWQEVKQEIEKI